MSLPQEALPGRKMKANRKADLLTGLYQSKLASPVLMDMNDAVHSSNAFPTFQYNRQSGAKNSILWPHNRVHDLAKGALCSAPDPAEPRLRDKKPGLVWRGSLRGFSRLGAAPANIQGPLKAFLDGRTDNAKLLSHLKTVPRYAFVMRYFRQQGFDVGLTRPKRGLDALQAPDVARYAGAFMAPEEQLHHRYQIAIQGTDVATNFAWLLGTNSVILREPYSWQVFFDGHFHPWEHYVPVAVDFSDVPEKIAWCEANLDACQAMIDRRHELVPLLLDGDVRKEALRRVVERYENFYAHWEKTR
ncbi:MAG: hypothetical protein JO056_09560 [Alphaproteobacteria bacterium]|nr:hypothetical protein [Alphaproteobacteria bacterium]